MCLSNLTFGRNSTNFSVKKDLSTPPESEDRAFATALMDQVESHADSFIFDSWLPRFEGLDDNDASHGQYGNNGGLNVQN